jgi:glycosyltransferase involved in cell wall biosynthesis
LITSNDKHTIRGIKYVSFNDSGGYSSAAKCYLRGLMKRVPITWAPFIPIIPSKYFGIRNAGLLGNRIGDPKLAALCNRKIVYDTVILHIVPEYYKSLIRSEIGKRIAGYVVWETDKLPLHWAKLLNMPEILLVPTKWNKEVLENGGVTKPIHVIPHIARGLKLSANSHYGGSFFGAHEDDYVFYTIGEWTTRKAIWKIVQCYLDTFSEEDSTFLLIKTSKFDCTKGLFNRFYFPVNHAIKKLLRNYKNPARIGLITNYLSDKDILRLHCRGNCYISLCRSEGWGLGAFDAASFGKPVIITGYGGQLEYLPKQLAYLVDYQLTSVIDTVGQKSYSPDQKWAEPDMIHASQLLRFVFENREKADQRGLMVSKHIHRNFNEMRITEKLLQALEKS